MHRFNSNRIRLGLAAGSGVGVTSAFPNIDIGWLAWIAIVPLLIAVRNVPWKRAFAIGFLAGIKAFTAAVLGGIGSLPGAMLGGLLIGLIETFWSAYFTIEYKDVAAFSILVLVLIFRPTGLLGKPDVEKV